MSQLFLDVETTGLPLDRRKPYTTRGNWPQIVQIAYAIVEDGERRPKCIKTALVRATRPISAAAERVHGISEEMCVQKGFYPKVLYTSLLKEVRDAGVVEIVAHNAEFDVNVLCNNLYEVCGMKSAARELYEMRRMCTMQHLTPIMNLPRRKYPKLIEAAHYFGIDTSKYSLHSAADDVKVLLKIHRRLSRASDSESASADGLKGSKSETKRHAGPT